MAKPIKRKVGRPPAENKLAIQSCTRLSEEMAARLSTAAVAIDRDPAWIMRTAIGEWLDRNGYHESKQS